MTSIGESAFAGCSSLTSITIPNSVKSIGDYAFLGCSSLTSITIPNSVISIGESAFEGCNSLTSITIHNSVTSIGDYAFNHCSSLKSITIPNSVTSIGEGAFQHCSSLTSITIPNSVTSIGECAFVGCSSLTSITIPNSVKSIGDYAFAGCGSLKSVKVANKYCYDYFKDEVDDIAFYGANASDDGRCLIVNGELQRFIAKGITEYTIPESVTSIGDYTFNGCGSLKSVKVANKDCYDYFKAKVANIAFYGANASDDGRCLIIDGELKIFIAKGITEYIIPESVTSIGDYTFNGCGSLKSVKVANKDCYDYFKAKVANIAFYGANASDDGRCLIIDGELKIFIAKGITEYTIPESVKSIGESAFRGCSNLTSITIPDSVKSIGEYAFFYCSSLKSITISNSVTYIRKRAFSGCSSLTSITIPNSVTNIGNEAFKGCSSLTSITIGNSVTSIGKDAFYNCDNLTSITCLATTPPAIDDLRIAGTTMIYVPKEAVKAYKKAPKWSIYKKQIKPIK